MNLLRRLLRSRPGRTMIVIVVLALTWQVYLTATAGGRVDDALAAEVIEGRPLRVTVTLGFPPERFHTLFLQDYGRITRVSGNSVMLRDVRPESVGMLARIYWIDRLSLPEATS